MSSKYSPALDYTQDRTLVRWTWISFAEKLTQ
jgi:hypothetical protein